jgi:hypothetical protein
MAKGKPRPGWDNPRDPRPKGAQKNVGIVRDYGDKIDRVSNFGHDKSKDSRSWDAHSKRKGGK